MKARKKAAKKEKKAAKKEKKAAAAATQTGTDGQVSLSVCLVACLSGSVSLWLCLSLNLSL